jgi:hypothetical protein
LKGLSHHAWGVVRSPRKYVFLFSGDLQSRSLEKRKTYFFFVEKGAVATFKTTSSVF